MVGRMAPPAAPAIGRAAPRPPARAPAAGCTTRRAAAGRRPTCWGGCWRLGAPGLVIPPSTPGRGPASRLGAPRNSSGRPPRGHARTAPACPRLYQQERIGEGAAERPGKLGRLTSNREEPWKRPARFGAPDTIPGGWERNLSPGESEGSVGT